jgi:hypothetical protein
MGTTERTTFHLVLTFSLDAADPSKCVGESVEVIPPHSTDPTLLHNVAHAPNPIAWCFDVARDRIIDHGRWLPPELPFP